MLHIVYGADASTAHPHETVAEARDCEMEAAVQAQLEQDARDEIFAEMRAEMITESPWFYEGDVEYFSEPHMLCAM